MAPMIQVEDLWKSFGGQSVLRGASFHVQAGEFLALVGMSGGGKSILLKHIVKLIQPDAGRVLVDGQDVAQLSGAALEQLRSRIGYVFQSGALFDSMTVFDNVAFPLREKTRLSEPAIRKRVLRELEQVGLTGAEEKYPAHLSGGMIKRVALARTLIRDPEIVLFDEPTTGLDPIVSKSILELFDSTHRRLKLTGILVSHEIPDIFSIVQKVALLHEGRIVVVQTPAEVMASQDPVVRQFIQGETHGPIRYR
jgi:phospholipid/cholesterol/gamma-HCH transport system ATP-binding protein